MALRHDVLEVGTTAVSVLGSVTDQGYKPSSTVVIQNNGAGSVYVGGAGVTTSDYGHQITSGGALVLDLSRGEVPYVVAASTQDVHLLYLGVDAE